MTFSRAINVGIGGIVCVVIALAFLFEEASREIVENIDKISLDHNDASRNLSQVERLMLNLRHEFNTFSNQERIPPDVFLQFLDRLDKRVSSSALAEPDFAAAAGKITRTIEAARQHWLDFFVRTPLLAFTDEALELTIDEARRHLAEAREALIDIAQNSENPAPREAVKHIARVIFQSENVLERYIDFPDTHIPRMLAMIARLEELISSQTLANLSRDIARKRSEALQTISEFGQAVQLIADERGSSLTSTAAQLSATAAAKHKNMSRNLAELQRQIGIQIERHHRQTISDIQRARALSLNGVLICLLVGVLCAIGLRRYLKLRISTVSTGVKAFTQGRLDERIPVGPSDELGVIASTFNHMADSLQIRERERADHLEKLDRARRSAEEANLAKSKFLAAMSHEIRTPMNGVLGMADLLSMESLSPRQHGFVESIRSSGQTLLTIINDILDFSKIEAGRLDLQPAEFDLCQTIDSVGHLLASSAHAKGLELAIIIDHTLADRRIGDAPRLRQVLINLVGNAIKFTHQGLITVRVSGDKDGRAQDQIRFEISDTGVGISREAQQSIFRPFTQVGGAVRGTSGTGLGLPISRNLVAMMGGRLTVDSSLGSGATFSFEIALPIAPQRTPAFKAPDSLGGIDVLVISEVDETRRGLVEQLLRLGVAHAAYASGREALHALRRRGDDITTLTFIDDSLGDMSGMEFARALQNEPFGASVKPVALCRVGEEITLAAFWHAVDIGNHLTKPVGLMALFDHLTEICSATPTMPGSAERSKAAGGSVLPRFASRVLVAEDHPVNLQVVVQMLGVLGCDVATVDNGADAIKLLHSEPFDLVLMDCDMPIMNGFEATAQIRLAELDSGQSRTVIVALTANALQGDRERCLNAGMDDYLSKPFDTFQLAEVLSRYLPADGTVTIESAEMADVETEAPGHDEVLDSEPILDTQLLETIKGAGVEFVCSLLDKFIENWLIDRDRLVDAIENGDAESARKSAHRMKSSSANIGAKRLSLCCAEIENAARRGDLGSLHDPMRQLDATYEKTINAFDERQLRVA